MIRGVVRALDKRPPLRDLKPKWVVLRQRLFMLAAALFIGFVMAIVMDWPALTLALLYALWGVLSVAVPLRHLPAMLRLASARFPTWRDTSERWIARMEFDLDRTERRP